MGTGQIHQAPTAHSLYVVLHFILNIKKNHLCPRVSNDRNKKGVESTLRKHQLVALSATTGKQDVYDFMFERFSLFILFDKAPPVLGDSGTAYP